MSMEWISVKDQAAPKDKPFLANTEYGVAKMEWRFVRRCSMAFYAFYNECCCCTGDCTEEFTHWMPLPQPPNE